MTLSELQTELTLGSSQNLKMYFQEICLIIVVRNEDSLFISIFKINSLKL